MSRVGKLPVAVPAGVTALVEGRVVRIKGPKGELSTSFSSGIEVVLENSLLIVRKVLNNTQANSDFGTIRALIQNMVRGVTSGWKRTLEMSGVGFGAKLNGSILVLSVGFSHEVHLPLPESVKASVTKTTIELESINKAELGNFAATVRAVQPPEPYLGKGIRYSDEVVRRKAGKTGKK
jgi:large subunit ribosomal protein L6